MLLVLAIAILIPKWEATASDPKPAWMQPMSAVERARYEAAWRANLEAGRQSRERAERDAEADAVAARLQLLEWQLRALPVRR